MIKKINYFASHFSILLTALPIIKFLYSGIRTGVRIYLFICTIFCRPQGNYVEKLQEKIRRKNCCQPALAAMNSGMPNRDKSLTFSVAKSTLPLQIKSK